MLLQSARLQKQKVVGTVVVDNHIKEIATLNTKGGKMERTLLPQLSVLTLAVCLFAGGTAFADENEVVSLRNDVKELKGVVASLQNEVQTLRTMKGHITPTPGKEPLAPYVAPGAEVPSGFVRALSDIHMAGISMFSTA